MPKAENPKSYSALTVADVAELLGVTDRQVRNWIKDKGLPANSDPRGRTLDWPETLRWYVAFRIAENGGNGGNRKPSNPDAEPLETMNAALAEVAAISDVERVLASANKSIQTLILALPSSLAPQLIGLADRAKIYAVIDRGVRATLGNLASIDAVRQSRAAVEDEEE